MESCSKETTFHRPQFWRAIAAETIGTALLVTIGCSVWTLRERFPDQKLTTVQVDLLVSTNMGLAMAGVVWIMNHASGSHMNPAVTCAMLAARRIAPLRAVFYIIGQLAGAVLGFALLLAVTGEPRVGAIRLRKKVSTHQGCMVELLATLFFVMMVFSAYDTKKKVKMDSISIPIAIGGGLTASHLMAIWYTGAGINPARVFGAAVLENRWTKHWIYWAGPVAGGVLGGLLYDLVFAADSSWSKAHQMFTKRKYRPDSFTGDYDINKPIFHIISTDDQCKRSPCDVE